MASPVKDAKANAQAKWPGAAVVERGKGHIKHQHPTDPLKFMTDHQAGSLGWHFGDGPFSEANEVDTAWVDADPILDAPWQKKMVLADYNVYAFREPTLGFDQGQLIEYVDPVSGETVNFQPMQLQWTNDLDQISPIEDPQAVSAVINDDMLTWTGAYGAGIDFQWQAQTARLMKFVNINSLANLGSPPQFIIDGGNPVLRVELLFQKSSNVEIWVDGVLWDERANNPQTTFDNVEFRASGMPIWWFRAPKAWDGEGEETPVIPIMKLRKSANNLFVDILTPWSWLETAIYPVVVDATVEYTVGASSDDAREISTVVSITSTTHVINSANEWAGYRWTGVTISDGVTIDTAYVTLVFSASPLRDDPGHTLDFEDGSAPGTFTTGSSDISGRTGTTATVSWVDSNIGAGSQNTPELKTIIQELEDSYDYSSGSSMVFRLVYASGNGIGLDAWDLGSTSTALLHIEYTAAGGVAPTSHILGPLHGPLGGPIA